MVLEHQLQWYMAYGLGQSAAEDVVRVVVAALGLEWRLMQPQSHVTRSNGRYCQQRPLRRMRPWNGLFCRSLGTAALAVNPDPSSSVMVGRVVLGRWRYMTDQFKADTSVGYRHEVIPPDEPDCKYLERWILGFGRPGGNSWFSLRLHHFFRSDEDHLHDHPGWFWTLMLRGTYLDYVECEWCGVIASLVSMDAWDDDAPGPFRVTPYR